MKNLVKGLLGLILLGVFTFMGFKIVTLSNEVETLQKANLYEEQRYEALQEEFEQYKETAESVVHKSFLNNLFGQD